MGTTTDAYLMYGYDLGSDDEWKLHGVDEDEAWEPEWLEDDDLIESAAVRLREAAGFTETDWRAEGYFDRRKEADARVGVEIETHCSAEYSMYVLAARTIRASRGDVVTVDVDGLQEAVTADGLDEKLARACEVLGIRPKQEKPAWLLCSYWG